jgi:hypothetical protein
MRLRRSKQAPALPLVAVAPTAHGYQPTTAPPGQLQALGALHVVSCDAAPFETALDHHTTMVWSGTVTGPAMRAGDLVNDAFESLAAVALRIGADALYTVRLTTAVDSGWMYATATATAAIPQR